MSTKSKAVVFTHFAGLQYGESEKKFGEQRAAYLRKYGKIIEHYLECNRSEEGASIDEVYVYVDFAVKEPVRKFKSLSEKAGLT